MEKAVADTAACIIPKNSVIDELNAMAKSKGGSFALTFYMLGSSTYSGFTG